MSARGKSLVESRVLVTGAAGGIGAATVDAFLRCGAQVVASDVRIADPAGDRTSAVSADLRTQSAGEALVKEAADRMGGLDVVAHVAGVLRRRSRLADVTEDDWDAQMDINLKASFFLLRAAGELMIAQGTGGRLVATASQAWWTGGYEGGTVYAASKGGLVSLCRGLARSYGRFGITVNTVAPGAIEPTMMSDVADETVAAIVADTPLHRFGRAEEVADVIAFLASPSASFVSGATINVSGGWLTY